MPRAPQITSTSDDPASMRADVLLVGVFSDADGPLPTDQANALSDATGGALARLGDTGFKGKAGELMLIPSGDAIEAPALAVLGLGDRSKLGSNEMRRAAGNAGRRLADNTSIAVALPLANDEGADLAAAAAEGLILGSYRFTEHKSDATPAKTETIFFPAEGASNAERGALYAEANVRARDLINEPASTLTPSVFADRAKQIAHDHDLVSEIWGPAELSERGFGGLLSVSRGSEEEPRFIQLRYVPENPKGKVTLIGKGVTYDTGGYSLKPPASMEQMKTDMAGGAAVIGVMSILRRLGVTVEVQGLIPATENLVSGKAVKPGDVIVHYGGRTTEVMNTDAEGRLILADALAFASEQKPDAIVDIATLTGSITVALGKKGAGLFSNDDALAAEITEAGDRAGELLWRMPLWPQFKSELESEVADQRNVGSRYGGAITASLFLESFLKEEVPWVHLDIAGPARAESDKDEISKGGSAFGVRTFTQWLERRSS
jgi:leucyl aminopeptidase